MRAMTREKEPILKERSAMKWSAIVAALLLTVATATPAGAEASPWAPSPGVERARPAIAQQETGTIAGRVVEASTGRPLDGVQISVMGGTTGTMTNAAGRFILTGVPAGDVTLRLQLIGFAEDERSVSVTSGATAQVTFELSRQAIVLDELVVTGTAGRQERRAQGATIANLNVADISELAPVSNVTEVLQGRIPGVSVSQASGVTGTGQTIRVRGASSVSLSNEPLIYVDGVRIDVPGLEVASGALVTPLNFLNPADIASIEVVKGPAAATLYGADATAGVIQIITKSGRSGTASGFDYRVSLSTGIVDPNFDPPSNFATCRPEDVNEPTSLCSGRSAGDVVSDNPLKRYDLLNNGGIQSLAWTARGGGEGWGLFTSLGYDREDGIFPNSEFDRYTARLKYDLLPTEEVRMEFSVPFAMAVGDYPVTGGSSRGWTVGGLAGTPLTVGTTTDGWFSSNRTPEAIAAVEYTLDQIRVIPDFKLTWHPGSWTHRITTGGDLSLTKVKQFYPKNDNGWYSSSQNRGDITEERRQLVRATFNYLGTLDLPITDAWGSTLSFGTEVQAEQQDLTFAHGNGLTTNAANSVSAAAQISGGQEVVQDRRVGFYAQWEPNFRERLYFQFGARADRFAAFGTEAPWFFSPSVRVSYVISDEPFFDLGWVDELRLRGAFGTTGRAPTAGVALRTYSAAPYMTGPTSVASGVIPLNAGNPDLEAELGQEIEVGFDAALLSNRLGLEVTYFDQTTRNLLLRVPQPPSLGFIEDPFRNIGEVKNRGVEVSATTQLLASEALAWEFQTGVNTLHNEVIDLGGVEPFSTIRFGQVNRVVEGYQVGGYWSHRILSVDPTNGVAIVSDSLEYMGNLYPALEGNVSTTITLFRNLRLFANVDFKQDLMQYNATAVYRERNFNIDERWVRQDEVLTEEEALRRYGPFETASGDPVGASSVLEEFIEPADLVRLNEVSLSYQLPNMIVGRLPAQAGSITLSGRNLVTWDSYSGFYPDVQNEFDAIAGRADFYTLPPPRRFTLRVDLSF